MIEVTIPIAVKFEGSDIADLMITAYENPYFDWVEELNVIKPDGSFRYTDPDAYEEDFQVVVVINEEYQEDTDEEVNCYITPEIFTKSLKDMAEKYPHIVENIVTENYDAIDADAFLQFMVFGEVVYG